MPERTGCEQQPRAGSPPPSRPGLACNMSSILAAEARNIFWAVAGSGPIHANAHFEGNILCETAITLQTKASMHGRALAQTLIALDDNAVTAP